MSNIVHTLKRASRDKTGMKGLVKVRKIELTDEGKRLIAEAREKYPDRKSMEYRIEKSRIYAEHSYVRERDKKEHNLKLFFKILRGIRMPGEFFECWNYEVSINHNIVTDEGDALIADLLQVTPERTKLDGTATIGVGTGFVSETKSVDALVTQTGADETLDSGYPQTKGDWGAADDNVIVYRCTFEAGDLNDTGIDEAILESTTPDCMAYAEISPTVNVSSTDTLQIDWEITLLGS